MDDIHKEMADAAELPYNGAVSQTPDEPAITKNLAGDFLFTWETVNGEFLRIRASDISITATKFNVYLTVLYKNNSTEKPRTLLSSKHWDIRSNSSTNTLFTALNRWKTPVDWHTNLTEVSDHLENNFETGDPFVWLDEVEDPGPISYLLEPLIQEGEHNVISAPGGSLKSMTALALFLSIATGTTIIPGIEPRAGVPVKCLYLDYETNAQTHKRRLLGLARAKGIEVPKGMIGYKRLHTPLVQMKSELARLIALQGFGFVLVDSVGRAVGGETVGEADVQAYYNATASFGITMLSVGHPNKAGSGIAGNDQWRNQARNLWLFEAAKEAGSNAVILGMNHDKVNEGELRQTMAYAVSFRGSDVSYASADAEDMNVLKETDLKTAITVYLGESPNRTVKEIAEALEKTEGRVANVLRPEAGKKWTSDGKRPARWMLLTGLTQTASNPVNNPVTNGGIENPLRGLSISPPVNSEGAKESYRLPYPDGGDDGELDFNG